MRARGTAAAVVAALAVAPPASAAVEIRVLDARAHPTVSLVAVTTDATAGAPNVTEDGVPAVGVVAETFSDAKSVVLAIDRSRSMRADGLDDAIAAARSFLATTLPSDRTALVAFGSTAVQRTPFSSSSRRTESALADLRLDEMPGTALYDAVVAAADALAREEDAAARVVILLTDGADSGSAATLTHAIEAASEAHVVVHAIGVEGTQFSPAPLEQIAEETGGDYHAIASTDDLERAYAAIADELARTWRIEYVTSARRGERVSVEVSFPDAGSATGEVRMPGSAPAPLRADAGSGFFGSRAGDLSVVALVGLLAFLAARRMAALRRTAALRRRLVPQIGSGAGRRSMRSRLQATSGLFAATERMFGGLGGWSALQRRLEAADVPLRAVELVYAMVGAGLAVGLLAAAVTASPAFGVLGLGLGALAPYAVVANRARRRRRAFEDQLPDLLMTLASSLKAGHGFRQGIQVVVDEGHEPVRKELARALSEARLGRPLEEALADTAERIRSADFKFVVSAVTIQQEVGGSLASVFDMVAATVRNRQQFARRVKALTAMGRMSAYVLVALPFALAAALTALNPAYMAPLYGTSTGRTMIGGTLVLMALGAVVLRKMVAFKG